MVWTRWIGQTSLLVSRYDKPSGLKLVVIRTHGKPRAGHLLRSVAITMAVSMEQLAAADGKSWSTLTAFACLQQAALFKLQMEAAEAAAKRASGAVGSSGVCVGEDVMSPEEVAAVQAARRDAFEQHRRAVELEAVHR